MINQACDFKLNSKTVRNYIYYPVIFKTEAQLLKVKTRLESQNIYPRLYFYPSLEELPYVKSNSCPVAKDIAKRVLCLPLYVGLETSFLNTITNATQLI